jgi:HSP20 family protein
MLPVVNQRRGEHLNSDSPQWSVDPFFSRWLGEPRWVTSGAAIYPVDIHEDDDFVYVEAEMPGFASNEITVTLEQGILSITAEHKERPRPEGRHHLRERRCTRYQRLFTLPTAVDDAKVEAKLQDGVLYLTFPKMAEVRPRRIAVK